MAPKQHRTYRGTYCVCGHGKNKHRQPPGTVLLGDPGRCYCCTCPSFVSNGLGPGWNDWDNRTVFPPNKVGYKL